MSAPWLPLNQIPRTLASPGSDPALTGTAVRSPHQRRSLSGHRAVPQGPAREQRARTRRLLVSVLALAFLGGVIFKGKSGWCSQFCPMLQVERFYGQSPLLVVRNSHCRPCVGCTKNCYDFNPTAAYLADLYDENPRLSANRKLFAGAMPWLIFAFFTQPELPDITATSVLFLYGRILFFVAAGIGVFMAVEAVSNLGSYKLVLVHVVVALNLFYWFVAPRAVQQFGLGETPLQYALQAAVAVLTVVWFLRALPRERLFLGAAHTTPARDTDRVLRVYDENRAEKVEVAFTPGPTVLAKGGQSLLEVAEANQVNMEAGCRMGMCGADPVRVTAGMENLSPVSSAERATLERLGLPAECRMACSAHVQGPVTVVPTADPAAVQGEPAATVPEEGATQTGFAISEEVRRIVVIGAGAAGVNAAIEVRKLHAGAEITLLGDEPYDFYNRMAIGKLVSEATAIDKLYLMPRDWASARRIRYLRGISATAIDRAKQEVRTDQGESIPYDRLLLATGAQSFVPEIEGFGLEGTFVLQDDRRRRPGPAVHPPPELPACPDHRWRIARSGGRAQHYRAGGLRLRTQPQRVAVEPPARPPRRHAPRKIDARLRHSHTALGRAAPNLRHRARGGRRTL